MKKLPPLRNRGYTDRQLRTVPVQKDNGEFSLSSWKHELDDYWAVLLGHIDPPVTGIHALQEVGDQYYARASEMTAIIQRGEADGRVAKGSELVKFRTGELRTFREVARAAAELGSRRLTARAVEAEQSRLGRDSAR